MSNETHLQDGQAGFLVRSFKGQFMREAAAQWCSHIFHSFCAGHHSNLVALTVLSYFEMARLVLQCVAVLWCLAAALSNALRECRRQPDSPSATCMTHLPSVPCSCSYSCI